MTDLSILLFMVMLLMAASLSATTESAKTEFQKPGTYKILTKEKTGIRIPFQMLHDKPVMQAKINGKPAALMIDNGKLWDEIWLFGSPLVKELGLQGEIAGTITGAGDGDDTEATMAENICISFEDIEFYDQVAYISPASAGFATAFEGTDGQICNTFFSHFVVEFDFDQMVIILHDPLTYQYTGDGSALDIVHENSGTCSLPISFTLANGKTYTGRTDMDLGGVHTILIALNNRNAIPVPENATASKLYGASGEFTVYESPIAEISIGKFQLKNPTAMFCNEESGAIHPGNLGCVGLPLLQKFNPIFDYHHDVLYLQPMR